MSALSREAEASRQTLYAWAAVGREALAEAFRPALAGLAAPGELSARC